MQIDGSLKKLPRDIRVFLAIFVVVLSIGFYTGILFVVNTDSLTPVGVEENYLGNEALEEAAVMKFKKSPREMLNIIHTHVLSMSLIFFLLGILVWATTLPRRWKQFLSIEPFISVILTFGGIYVMWLGLSGFKYVVILSGVAMTLTFVIASGLVLFQLLGKHASSQPG